MTQPAPLVTPPFTTTAPPPERWRANADGLYFGYAIKFGNPQYECIISAPEIDTLQKIWLHVSSTPFIPEKVYRVFIGNDSEESV